MFCRFQIQHKAKTNQYRYAYNIFFNYIGHSISHSIRQKLLKRFNKIGQLQNTHNFVEAEAGGVHESIDFEIHLTKESEYVVHMLAILPLASLPKSFRCHLQEVRASTSRVICNGNTIYLLTCTSEGNDAAISRVWN